MLTPAARGLTAAAAALGASALLTGYAQPAVLAAVAAAALAVALAVVRRPAVTVESTWESSHVVAGSAATLTIRVTNATSRRAAPLEVATVVAGLTVPTVSVPRLGAGHTHATPVVVAEPHRGRYTVGQVHAQRQDPLGLVLRRTTTSAECALIVHPRTAPVHTPGRHLGGDDDGYTSPAGRRGGSVFHALRDYELGDDPRLIHWPTTARTGTLIVRDVVVPEVQRHIVVVDTCAVSYAPQGFEEAVSVAASVALAVGRRQNVLVVTTAGDSFAVDARVHGARTLLLDWFADLVSAPAVSSSSAGLRLRDAQGAAVTVVTGAGTVAPSHRLGRFDDAVFVTTVVVGAEATHRATVSTSTSSTPSARGSASRAGAQGAVTLKVDGLSDFVESWNACWRE